MTSIAYLNTLRKKIAAHLSRSRTFFRVTLIVLFGNHCKCASVMSDYIENGAAVLVPEEWGVVHERKFRRKFLRNIYSLYSEKKTHNQDVILHVTIGCITAQLVEDLYTSTCKFVNLRDIDYEALPRRGFLEVFQQHCRTEE